MYLARQRGGWFNINIMSQLPVRLVQMIIIVSLSTCEDEKYIYYN